MSQQIPEGWYPDPQQVGSPGAERWWNGYQWTAHTRVTAPAYPAPADEMPPQPAPYGEQNAGWRPEPMPPGRGAVDLPDGRRLADIGARLGAYLVDLVIVFILVSPLRLALPDSLEGGVMLVAYVTYQVAFLRVRGATPGRMMAAIGVEPEPGSPADGLDLGGLALRTLVLAGPFYPSSLPVLGVFGIFLPLIAIILAARDPRRQGPHDRFAHTVVVNRPR